MQRHIPLIRKLFNFLQRKSNNNKRRKIVKKLQEDIMAIQLKTPDDKEVDYLIENDVIRY